ncbi:hypothetical protein NtRootA9_27830 [Arthrobacter sp. NtRootA9]|nr:hypothetical protein NtRootA9_27830 [Arthrobacter sp. NtRootA9]
MVPAQATFGRDGAMFEGLLDFVAQLSLVLWGLVVLTVVIRFAGVGLYRHGAARRARARAAAAAAMAGEAADGTAHGTADSAAGPALLPAPAGLAAPTGAALAEVLAADATFSDGLQPAQAPAAVVPSVQVAHRAFRLRRRHVPALANSTDG